MPKINLTDLSNLQNEVTATAAINNNNAIIEDAIDNSISRDGTQPNNMNANLDMNSNKIINLPDAASDQEPLTYGQFLEGVSALENGAVIDADFVTLSSHPSITNERVLTPGPSLELVDGGPGGTVLIGVSSAELNALGGTGSEADKIPYYDGIGSAEITDFTSFARTLLADADASEVKTDLELVKADVGLDQVDNTSDANKPISTATQTALDNKVTGPASVVAARVAIFNGTTGKLIQDGGRVLPSGSIVGTSDTQTITNKTINGSNNTITNIPNASVTGLGALALKSQATVPGDLATTGTPNGTKFLRDDGQWTSIPGGGDLLSTNNLADVSSISTSRSNLGALGGGLKTQVFTSSGTFTTPATSRTDTVYRYRMIGGGGGGGGSGATGQAGGGGAGAYAEGTFTSIAASTGITITVGGAGAGGAASTTGGSGGSTSIGSPVSITCSGGAGGTAAATGVSAGGLGGTVTGIPNIMGVSGQRGMSGFRTNSSGDAISGGPGASSQLGTGGIPGQSGISGSALATGTGYGAGGGGGFATGLGTNGSPGIVIIEWFES